MAVTGKWGSWFARRCTAPTTCADEVSGPVADTPQAYRASFQLSDSIT